MRGVEGGHGSLGEHFDGRGPNIDPLPPAQIPHDPAIINGIVCHRAKSAIGGLSTLANGA